jgi:hypothetical protein
VNELGRRRRELTDWRLQVRRHGSFVAVAGGVLLGVTATFLAFTAWRSRRHERELRSVRGKARSLRRALARVLEHPDKVASPGPNIGQKILAAGGSALVVALIKRLATG